MENTFARIKQFRGIATRYDKLKQNYENSVDLLVYLFGYHYEMSTDPNKIPQDEQIDSIYTDGVYDTKLVPSGNFGSASTCSDST